MHSIQIDGKPADLAGLGERIGAHVTASASFLVRMQRVRGLDHHLDRLVGHSRDPGDRQAQRAALKHAISAFIRSQERLEALRVERFRPTEGDQERTLIMGCTPRAALAPELRLRSAARDSGTAAEESPARREAVLLDGDEIHGTTVGALGFVSRGRVIWPDSAAAPPVEQLLVHEQLSAGGVACAVVPVRLEDVGLFEASFIVGDHGVSTLTEIDDVSLTQDVDGVARIRRAFDRIPWLHA